jgi:hypothetical protein
LKKKERQRPKRLASVAPDKRDRELRYGSTAQEVNDDGDNCQDEQNVNHAGGDVKRDETEQPHNQQNQPD